MRRLAAIEVTKRCVRGGVFRLRGQLFTEQRTTELPCVSGELNTAEIADAIAQLTRELGCLNLPLALIIPTSWCFFRLLTLPFQDPKQIDEVLRSRLVGELPRDPDECFVTARTVARHDHGARVFAACCPKQPLLELVRGLHGHGVVVDRIEPRMTAVIRAIRPALDEQGWQRAAAVALEPDAVELALLEQGNPYSIRRLSCPGDAVAGLAVEELRRNIIVNLVEPVQGIVLCGAQADVEVNQDAIAQSAGVPVIAAWASGGKTTPAPSGALAGDPLHGAALALADGSAEAFDLRREELLAFGRGRVGPAALAVCLALLCALATTVGWQLHQRALEAREQWQSARKQQENLWELLFPGRPVPAAPRVHLAAELRRLNLAQTDGPTAPRYESALDRLREMLAALPQDLGLTLQSVRVNPQRVELAVRVANEQSSLRAVEQINQTAAFQAKLLRTTPGEAGQVYCEIELTRRIRQK